MLIAMDVGIYEATSLEHNRKDSTRNSDLSNGEFDDHIQMSSLPTWSICTIKFSLWNMNLLPICLHGVYMCLWISALSFCLIQLDRFIK